MNKNNLDTKAEKLIFIRDKIVDLGKIFSAKSLNDEWATNDDFNGINNEDQVIVNIPGRQYFGEVKWLGIINTEKCVGVDMVGFISIFSYLF